MVRDKSHSTRSNGLKRILFTLSLVSVLSLLFHLPLAARVIRIGECQTVSRSSFDNDSRGFKAGLAQEGFVDGKNIAVERLNALGDPANCARIARKFEDDRVDLIHAISAPCARASANVSKTIPVVFSSVTDPVDLAIIPAMGKTGTNVTGVSDKWPVSLQCEMYQRLIPGAKRWGTIYNPGDAGVTLLIQEMRQTVERMGGRLVEARASAGAEVMRAAQSLVGRVEAIHISSDKTSLSAFESIVKVCNESKTPLFAGDVDSVLRGAVAAYGLDYFKVGRTAGRKAAMILRGARPGEVEAGLAEGYSLWVSKQNARLQGLKLPGRLPQQPDRLWDEQGAEPKK